ncbi:unnamed protein product [Pleuronectes platessa]|uniref:Uncharacterized protein n=1 Tax=Pleuronectes platessa TaxID=8262 RepID=A0A9N7U7F9_PLEPL|nr:unnamed protein product [Pleuronectes platessa]
MEPLHNGKGAAVTQHKPVLPPPHDPNHKPLERLIILPEEQLKFSSRTNGLKLPRHFLPEDFYTSNISARLNPRSSKYGHLWLRKTNMALDKMPNSRLQSVSSETNG